MLYEYYVFLVAIKVKKASPARNRGLPTSKKVSRHPTRHTECPQHARVFHGTFRRRVRNGTVSGIIFAEIEGVQRRRGWNPRLYLRVLVWGIETDLISVWGIKIDLVLCGGRK